MRDSWGNEGGTSTDEFDERSSCRSWVSRFRESIGDWKICGTCRFGIYADGDIGKCDIRETGHGFKLELYRRDAIGCGEWEPRA